MTLPINNSSTIVGGRRSDKKLVEGLYQRLLHEHADDYRVYKLYADYLVSIGRYANACNQYAEAGLQAKGNQKLIIEYYSSAEATSHLMKKIDTQFQALCHNNIGATYAKLDMLDEAIHHTQTAIDIDPNCNLAKFNIGYYQLKNHDYVNGWPNHQFRLTDIPTLIPKA